MKLRPSIHCARNRNGFLLIECLVYLAIFVLIFGLALASFYRCSDNSKALLYATDDVAAALHAGERWRADVRGATGPITVETAAAGEQLRIPCGTNAVLYRFDAGEVHRQLASSDYSELVLPTVKASQMLDDARGPVRAWRWELELKPHRKETHLPLLFTFEAAQTKP
jgi:type II secretory pathway pseudopilin PulG